MNREIKFRAWDEEEKQMWNENNIVVGGGVFLYGSHNTETLVHSYVLKDDLIPMQFTGLLDKNGKEIYEGDIVQWREANGHLKTEKVVWEEELLAYVTRDEVDFVNTYLGGTQRNHLEIIGNIHENNDLLA